MIWTKECLNKKISVLIMSAALSACGIKEEQKDQSINKSSLEEISSAILAETASVSILDVKKDQMVHYEENWRAEVNNVYRSTDTFRRVIFNEVDDYQAKVIMREDYYSYDQSGINIVEEKHSDIDWTESTEGQVYSSYSPLNFVPKALEKSYEFYNLNVEVGTYPLPEATAQKSDCGGFTNCQVSGRTLSYLRYTKEDGKISSKQLITMTLSKELPPLIYDPSYGLPPILNLCIREHYADQVLLTTCLVLRDVIK